MSSSEIDMSEGSTSPPSCSNLESPGSSPMQLVPQLSSPTFGNLPCNDGNLYNNTPFLRITEQPQNYFRFRYDTEKSGSTHGSILAKSFIDNKTTKKAHPAVELVNYSGKAVITCSIKYENDKNVPKNIYEILEEEQNSQSYQVPQKNSYQVGFRGIGVHTIKKTALAQLLYRKILERSPNNRRNPSQLRTDCENLSKIINQNVVRLKFTALDMNKKEICRPVFSDLIYNKKSSATNALKIRRMSAYSCRASGREDIILLVDKIDKNDISVRFYEESYDGSKGWEAYASFMPHEVHHQCAIPCIVPPYKDVEISSNVTVWVELVRPSNENIRSDPVQFQYIAEEACRYKRRRKMATPRSTTESDDSYSGSPAQVNAELPELPVIVVPNDPTKYEPVGEFSEISLPTATLQNEWQRIFTSTAEILDTVADDDPMWGQSLINQFVNVSQTMPQVTVATEAGMSQVVGAATQDGGAAQEAATSQIMVHGAVDLFEIPQAVIESLATPQEFVASNFDNSSQSAVSSASSDPTSCADLLFGEDFVGLFETGLSDYADVFGMTKDDFYQTSEVKADSLVSDSGRVKVQPHSPMEKIELSELEDDVPRFQSGPVFTIPTNERQRMLLFGPQNLSLQTTEKNNVSQQPTSVTATGESIDDHIKHEMFNGKAVIPQCYRIPHGPVVPQGPMEIEPASLISEEVNVVTAQGDTEGVIMTLPKHKLDARTMAKRIIFSSGVSKHAGLEASGTTIEEASNSANEENNKSKGVETQKIEGDAQKIEGDDTGEIDYPASYSPEDAAEIKKLVPELFEIIRDKKTTKREVAKKLERLFEIRLSNGDTFLHMTLFKNRRSFEALVKMVESVKMSRLLNCPNDRGETILHLAVVRDVPELVTLLTAKGCDVNARTRSEESVLHYAVRFASAATLSALLEGGGAALALDAANAERQSALHLCALHGRAVCAARLAARGANGGARDAHGRTPLHLCAYDAREDVARALRLAGAPPDDDARRFAAPYPLFRELFPDSELDDEPHYADGSDDLTDLESGDEYESADDEYIGDSAPDSLAWSLGEMKLVDGV